MKTSAKIAAIKTDAPPKCGTFMGIKGVQLNSVHYEFSQDSDTNQIGDDGQCLKAYTEDSGAGSYLVIETERWAIDSDDIDKFCATLKKICNTPEEYEK